MSLTAAFSVRDPKGTDMKARLIVLIAASALAGSAHAGLVNRGGGLIYDDVTNVTWLEDAAAMNPNRHRFSGAWDQAADFTFYDVLRDRLLDDWRLPMKDELASLWAQGVRGGSDQLSSPFKNLVAGPYWGWDWNQPIPTGGGYSLNWDFRFGGWAGISGDYNLYAMPVRVGDVGAPPVIAPPVTSIPTPSTVALALAGFMCLALQCKHRTRQRTAQRVDRGVR